MLSREAIFINLLLPIGLILLLMETPARKVWARLCAVILMHSLTVAYVVWRFQDSLPPFAWTAQALWPWCFFGCEMTVIVYELWSLCVLTRMTDHSHEADGYERTLRKEWDLPTVDIFIPSYNEAREILEATIAGALEVDYPRSRIRAWILDDGRRPWLEELCHQRGIGYFARPTNEHGKAGNLNYALPRTSGEFIVIIDADFILEKHFLYRTLGFLLYRKEIGLVQTPQHFRNPDPIQHNLFGGSAWTEEQHFFMTIVESARDAYGNAFCVGSGWVIKRSRLDELGGFPQASICEDLEITYALKARGYRTLFLNEALSYGLAPESVPEYIKQRVRWCSGTIQHIFLKTGPLRSPRLSLVDRLFYLEPIVYWVTYPFVVMLVLAPIIFWYTGVAALDCRVDDMLIRVVPRFVASYILVYWLSEGKVVPPITTVHKILPAFHLAGAVAKAIVRPFGKPFSVTLKGQSRAGVVVQWPIISIFLALAAALLVGMVINLSGYHQVVDFSELTTFDIVWSVYSLMVILLCALACVEFPKGSDYIDAKGEVLHANLGRLVGALARRLWD